jgi:hypothetical protein
VTQYAEFPVETDKIKHDIRIRREAVTIMMGEIEALRRALKAKIGPVEWLRWMQEQAAEAPTRPGAERGDG